MSASQRALDHLVKGLTFAELTKAELIELTGLWLLEDCPGVPGSAADYFGDGVACNGELDRPVMLKMAGQENPNYDIWEILCFGLVEECRSGLSDFWQQCESDFTRNYGNDAA